MCTRARARLSALQLGVPFSDPMADGGVIQAASQVALTHGVTLRHCLDMVATARAQGLRVPVVLMGYYNPILQYGEEHMVRDSVAAGVDGYIIVDLPPEDARLGLLKHIDAAGLAFIPLVAPTTAPERIPSIAAVARGFIYCVSVLGVTGARSELPPDLAQFVQLVKKHVALPVAVGFGISTRAHVQAVAALADGVVMGSAIIKVLQAQGVAGLAPFLQSVVPT
jgi:tryptophan synthase alpha subunit